MVKVAIAGGNGSLGRTIVEALEADSNHEFFILTRKGSEQDKLKHDNKTIAIDYEDSDSIATTLEQLEVHTVISVLPTRTPEQNNAQLNLIRGAAKASSVMRFTPSEFGTPRSQVNTTTPKMLDHKAAAVVELDKTDLEYTLFSHGIFMDYYGKPGIKSHMKPWVFAIDIANKVAGIPGSGNVPAVYTYSGDVAKFVVATLGLPDKTWQTCSVMVGDRKTFNEILYLAESTLGEKFTVSYDSVEKMQSGQVTQLPSHHSVHESVPKDKLQSVFAHFGISLEQGEFDFRVPKGAKLLNDIFPNIVPLSMEEVIREGWS